MTIICNDSLAEISSIYFDVSEEEIMSIYQFIDREYGLPQTDSSQDDRDMELNRQLSSMDSMTMNF